MSKFPICLASLLFQFSNTISPGHPSRLSDGTRRKAHQEKSAMRGKKDALKE